MGEWKVLHKAPIFLAKFAEYASESRVAMRYSFAVLHIETSELAVQQQLDKEIKK